MPKISPISHSIMIEAVLIGPVAIQDAKLNEFVAKLRASIEINPDHAKLSQQDTLFSYKLNVYAFNNLIEVERDSQVIRITLNVQSLSEREMFFTVLNNLCEIVSRENTSYISVTLQIHAKFATSEEHAAFLKPVLATPSVTLQGSNILFHDQPNPPIKLSYENSFVHDTAVFLSGNSGFAPGELERPVDIFWAEFKKALAVFNIELSSDQ